jgi:hypothetical protein
MARTTESLTALMIEVKIRYTSLAGLHLTGLPEALWEWPRESPGAAPPTLRS